MGIHGFVLIESGPGVREIENKKLRRGVPLQSSVSSEWAFSSAGITISKRRNRLKGNIVEALQCLKCMIRKNLIFRQDPTLTIAKQIVDLEDLPETESK